MDNLFSQPDLPEDFKAAPPKPVVLVDEFLAVSELYPNAWRIERLQTVIPKTEPDRKLSINNRRLRIWEFIPFPESFKPEEKLIIYFL
jgi:hypothetical protein